MTRIVKENYYLDIAETVLERSTCLRRQYGAIIVRNDEIVASGYNGAPRGRKNCCDLGYCVREQMQIPRGERYELCRSVHAEANAIISASRNECIGGDLYLAGHDARTGEILHDATSCSMCRRMIINAGIRRVVIRNTREEFKVVPVQDWINEDDTIRTVPAHKPIWEETALFYVYLTIFAAAIVAVDQWTKALAAAQLTDVVDVLIPGWLELRYLLNDGMALSMFRGGRWVFVALTVVFFAFVVWIIAKKHLTKKPELWCLAAITGGAIGNLIDRVRTGAVVDMISIPWFSTFNVADLFITFGAIILVLYIFIKDKEFLSDGPKKDKTDDADAEH